jgi:NADH dehydrogenase (ubiquinone) 1 beta subcomplex subunit 10
MNQVFKGEVEYDEGPPDNFDPQNPYADSVAFLGYGEYLVREEWIGIETAKILKEKVKW